MKRTLSSPQPALIKQKQIGIFAIPQDFSVKEAKGDAV